MIGAKIRSITKAHKPDRFRRVPDLGRGSSVISACLSESELDTQFQIVFLKRIQATSVYIHKLFTLLWSRVLTCKDWSDLNFKNY